MSTPTILPWRVWIRTSKIPHWQDGGSYADRNTAFKTVRDYLGKRYTGDVARKDLGM